MKPTDYAPRASPFDLHIIPGSIGVEVGCDVGAHAEAILKYRQPLQITVIDLWENQWCEGYCFGRLREYPNVKFLKGTSHELIGKFVAVDWVYIDIEHDYHTVNESLNDWWEKLNPGGVMGYRNYTACKSAIDPFIVGKKFIVDAYSNEIVIWKV